MYDATEQGSQFKNVKFEFAYIDKNGTFIMLTFSSR
jgi:hypothetical protein